MCRSCRLLAGHCMPLGLVVVVVVVVLQCCVQRVRLLVNSVNSLHWHRSNVFSGAAEVV